jgi:hypothetical protein
VIQIQALVGAWSLLSLKRRYEDGQEVDFMGPSPIGVIIYTSCGRRSVHVCARRRIPRFAAADLSGGTIAERVAAFDTYLAYAGRYEVAVDTIHHHIDISSFPNWTGTTQPRRASLTEHHLELRSQVFEQAGCRFSLVVHWERAN